MHNSSVFGGIFVSAALLAASPLVRAQTTQSPCAVGSECAKDFREAHAAGEAAKVKINKDMDIIRKYDDALTANNPVLNWKACSGAFARLKAIAHKAVTQNPPKSPSDAIDIEIGTVLQSTLDNMDANPCPTFKAYKKFGNQAFSTPATE